MSVMISQILKLPFWAILLFTALLLLLIIFIFSSLNPWNPLNYLGRPSTTVDISRMAVIRNIQSLNRLETTSYTIEKVIEAGTEGNMFQEILYGDRLLLIATGQVEAGVDLSKIVEADVQIAGDTLTVRLPNTEIFSAQLLSEQTKVYDRQLGILSRGDKDLETEARQAAERTIRQSACQADILDQAAADTRAQLSKMYTLAGFSNVEVHVQPGECME